MASANASALLEALFTYCNAYMLDLDKRTKAALRLCNKHLKNLVDATVTAASTRESGNLNVDLSGLIKTEWHGLKNLVIYENDYPNPITELPPALFIKFSLLEALEISCCTALESLPTEIGELQHLKSLQLERCHSLSALPSSLGRLTALEKIILHDCRNLTPQGLAPLQHLTGLTSFVLSNYTNMVKFPEFICNLTSLKDLHLYSPSIDTLPTALGNLTNLESLTIGLEELKELPESIRNLSALKELEVKYSKKLTTLPESLDDLLWRKAHEKEESKKMELVDFTFCPNLVLSPKMKQALDLLEQKGADIILS